MLTDSMTGLNRAAILLMCLGEEATAKIFAELSDDEVNLLSRTMATINHIPGAIKDKVLAHYRQARQQSSGQFFKGSAFARKAISAIGDSSRMDSLLKQYVANTEDRPLATIARMKPAIAADLLEREHPQTTALILSTQQARHAADILALLPETLQADIVYRIGRLEKVSSGVLNDIESALQREMERVTYKQERLIGGIDLVVDLLLNLKNNHNTKIIDQIGETDDDLAEQIRRKMFSFDNLINLDGRSLQMILREVNNESLALALKNASGELKEKIFANMSPRAADMIRDDLEALGPVRFSEVDAMQQSIVKIALKLEEEGKFLPGENEHVLD